MLMSALISFAIVYQVKEKMPIKMVYLIINILVLFSVSVGGNTLSNKASQVDVVALFPDLIASAYAHEAESEHKHKHDQMMEDEVDFENHEELKRYVQQLKMQKKELEKQVNKKDSKAENFNSLEKKRSFSDNW